MSTARFPLLLAPFLLPLSLAAQNSASPASSGSSLLPEPPSQGSFQPGLPLSLSDSPGQLPLIPPASDSALGALPDFDISTRKQNAPIPDGPNRTEEAAIQLAQRIRFREIKAKAITSPEVQAPLVESRNARSDRELRTLLRKHYQLLYSKMEALDPSLQTLIREQQARSLTSIAQSIGPEKP